MRNDCLKDRGSEVSPTFAVVNTGVVMEAEFHEVFSSETRWRSASVQIKNFCYSYQNFFAFQLNDTGFICYKLKLINRLFRPKYSCIGGNYHSKWDFNDKKKIRAFPNDSHDYYREIVWEVKPQIHPMALRYNWKSRKRLFRVFRKSMRLLILSKIQLLVTVSVATLFRRRCLRYIILVRQNQKPSGYLWSFFWVRLPLTTLHSVSALEAPV